MKEEAKYYTPRIEEFCVGFEFTYTSLGKRLTHILEEEDLFNTDEGGMTPLYDMIFSDPLVKILDKKDIEKLLWKHTGGQMISGGKSYFEKGGYSMTLRPRFYKDGFASIHIYKVEIVTDPLFAGKIKNKSELKRLLVDNLELI